MEHLCGKGIHYDDDVAMDKRQHEEMPAWVWSWCDSSNFGRLKLLCVEESIMHCESAIAASGGHPAPPSKMFVFLVEEMRFLDDIVNSGLEISILACGRACVTDTVENKRSDTKCKIPLNLLKLRGKLPFFKRRKCLTVASICLPLPSELHMKETPAAIFSTQNLLKASVFLLLRCIRIQIRGRRIEACLQSLRQGRVSLQTDTGMH